MSLKDLLNRFKSRKSGPSTCHPESHSESGLEGIPDFVEPLVGWRAWKVRAPHSGVGACPSLSSVILDTPWAPGRRFSAEHSFDLGAKCRGLLRLDCSCGVYAFKDPLDAFVYLVRVRDRLLGMSVEIAMGTVSLWGKVIECESGYKAEYAYPRHVYLPASYARFQPAVSSAFGVDTGVYAFTCEDELKMAISPASNRPQSPTLRLNNSGMLKLRGFPYEVGFFDVKGAAGSKKQLLAGCPNFELPTSAAPDDTGDYNRPRS